MTNQIITEEIINISDFRGSSHWPDSDIKYVIKLTTYHLHITKNEKSIGEAYETICNELFQVFIINLNNFLILMMTISDITYMSVLVVSTFR